MRLHRFYISKPIKNNSNLTIDSSDLVNQIRNVFRLKAGDSVVAFDGSGMDYVCDIKSVEKDSICLVPKNEVQSRYIPIREISLCAALVKKDKFEWLVEKATELGVSKIVPLISERSEKKSLNMERITKIAIEASEQSGRGNLPIIEPITNLEKLVSLEKVDLSQTTRVLNAVFHTEGESINGLNTKDSASINIFIGPEGGWSPKEIEVFHRAGYKVVCLGKQVLRSETAVVASLSQFVFA